MSTADTALKHVSLAGPGACVHPIAIEKLLKASNLVDFGEESGSAPENITAALNGGFIG
jgi:hypothetical protein